MRFFSVDNPVWRFIRKIGYLWLLNILWVLTSLPVITIGASTTALFYACMKLQGDEGYPTANYFRSFRENFRQATIIWLIYAAVGALLVYGLIFWNLMDGRLSGSGTRSQSPSSFLTDCHCCTFLPYRRNLSTVSGIRYTTL